MTPALQQKGVFTDCLRAASHSPQHPAAVKMVMLRRVLLGGIAMPVTMPATTPRRLCPPARAPRTISCRLKKFLLPPQHRQ